MSDLPPLNALRAFEAAARLGSVSKAGEELFVTHGAVSRQIRALEEQLGVVLFVREGRGLALTEAGVRLRDASAEAFERLRSTCADLKRGTREAPFVLGCSGSLLARWFIPRLDRLNRELPDLRLSLSTSEGELDPRRPGLNATLLFAEPEHPSDMQVYSLAAECIGPVLSPRYAGFAHLVHAPAAALLHEPLLHTVSRPQAWPAWAQRHGLLTDQLTFGAGFEHLYYLLEAAVAGLGVAIAPKLLVEGDLATGRLVAPWGFVETGARLALWVPGRLADPRAQRLAEWLRLQLEEG
ncbi:DNA-binding transcriptional LysR family regulator [Pseudomonas duriflava]|uniref:HTH-type transcriptional regulator TrpI n=1 Tax=Pseudomonas duriflava TaxID=459528 RepID=A0A562QLA6_9PSED|nr:LysR family transcriptional regulator [Pseudomonas duriflava]TWI57542.1 DNA-binding transcriptional LysR family regulator [Pseudomonas duriflava]